MGLHSMRLGTLLLALLLAGAATVWADADDSKPRQDPKFTEAVKDIRAQNYKQGIDLLTEVVAKNPQDADAFNYIGYSYRKLGDVDHALEFYNKALALDPKHKGAHEYLGELYLEIGQPDKAKAELAKLDKICWMGCEEYDDLSAAIKRFESGKKVSASDHPGKW